MDMKRRIYIFVLLALLLASLPELALAAAPSPVAIPVCDYRSHVIPYPTAKVDTGSADCLAEYAIPYPAADFEGDGITAFVRSTINSSAETESAMSPVPDESVVNLMAFPFEGLNPHGPVADTTTASVELMAFPFEGLNPHRPVADTPTANVELMAFPFEGLNPR
jgi:hypothetical protein